MRPVLLLLLLVTACGMSSSSADPSDAGPIVDGGGVLAASEPSLGSVILFSEEDAYTIHATLRKYESRYDGACKRTIVSTCEVSACGGPDETPPSYRYVDAGPLSVDGLANPLVLEPGAASYKFIGARGPFYVDGATIRFRAPGAEVPAFEETLPTPPLLDFDVPGEESGTIVVERSTGLVVTWPVADVKGAAVEVTVTTSAFESGNSVRCTAGAADGKITLPPAALVTLAATSDGGRGGTSATFEIEAVTSKTTVLASKDSIGFRAERRRQRPPVQVVVR
jgi:hypothetical protein